MSSLLKRASRGVGASAVQQAATILIQIATVPILLSHWGVAVYGAWLILSAVPSYLSLTDFGFGTAASNQMAMRYARGDMDGARASFSAAIILSASSAAVCAIIVLAATSFLPIGKLFGVAVLSAQDAKIILTALSLSLLAGMLRTVFYSVLYADGRYPLGIVMLTTCRILDFVVLTGTALLGGSPAMAAVAGCVLAISSTLAYGAFALFSSPWLNLRALHIRFNELKQLTAPSLSFLLFPLSNALNIQGVILIIGITSSPHAVVTFATLRTLSRFAVMPLRSLMDAMRPEMSRSYGLGDMQTLRTMASLLTWVSMWTGLCIILGLSVIGPQLIWTWTAGKVTMIWPVYLVLMLTAWTQAIAYPSYMILYASNRHRFIAISYLTINLLVVGLCLLVPGGQIVGQAGVLLLAELTMAGIAITLGTRMIGTSPWALIKALVAPPHGAGRIWSVALNKLGLSRATS